MFLFHFVRIISKILSAVILSVCFVVQTSQPAKAFFTENYKANLNYGVFKKAYNTDLYIGLNANFLMKTWMPNVTTTVMGSNKWLNIFNSAVPGYMTKNPISKYSFGFGISAGLHSHGSNFRHEIMFDWYSILSKQMNIGGEMLPMAEEGKFIKGTKIGENYYSDIGVYSNIYRVTYNMFYNFQNVFNLFNIDWDIYFGIGAGLAIVRAGIYSTSSIKKTTKTETTNSGDPDGEPTTTETNTYALETSKISTASSAGSHKIMAKNYFAAAYQFQVGVLANLSQSFAMNIGLTFAGTSRPFFSTDFKTVKSVGGSKMNLEYHIALNVGILIKSFELAL